MHGLNCVSSAVSDGGCPAQHGEDVVDDFLCGVGHSRVTIRCSDIWQDPDYPIIADAGDYPLWQSGCVDGSAFDLKLVATAMKQQGVTQTTMARVMRLPGQSAFSNIMKKKRRVTAEEAKRAYEFLGIAVNVGIQFVPIIGITSAGNWREAIQLPMGSLPIPPGNASGDAFALEVSGDSMDKLIADGGYVVVDPTQKELHDGKCYLIQNDEGEATVKRYRREPARFEPVSTNPEHREWLVSEQDFSVLGRVVWKAEAI